jgi:hypothetical protein
MIFHSLIGCCTAYGSGYIHLFLSQYCVLPSLSSISPNLETGHLVAKIWKEFELLLTNEMQYFLLKSLLCISKFWVKPPFLTENPISSNYKFLLWAINAVLDRWFRIRILIQSNSGFGTQNPVQNCLKQ